MARAEHPQASSVRIAKHRRISNRGRSRAYLCIDNASLCLGFPLANLEASLAKGTHEAREQLTSCAMVGSCKHERCDATVACKVERCSSIRTKAGRRRHL